MLIPVFALGRMQEILKIIYQGYKSRKIPKTNVFATGLGVQVAEIIDKISKKQDTVDFQNSMAKELKIQKPQWDIKPGANNQERGIYLLGSGMLVENTPSYNFAATMIDHPQNSIFFVGYSDPDTPGGKLLASKQGDQFLFETLDYMSVIKAHVEKFDLSGHANREELLDLALELEPRSVILTHGDPEARDWFFDELTEKSPKTKVLDPEPLKRYKV